MPLSRVVVGAHHEGLFLDTLSAFTRYALKALWQASGNEAAKSRYLSLSDMGRGLVRRLSSIDDATGDEREWATRSAPIAVDSSTAVC